MIELVVNYKDPFNGKSQNHNLSVNEGFVILMTSKFITSFIDSFVSK